MSLDFDKQISEFFEDNGWGKTTLCVFLKAMFYGLEYSPRKKEMTERDLYQPWDGGVYGGSLVFESESGRYRVERTFGSKDKDDTFAVYDLPGETQSSAYNENIGEELFEVDRESFERSIFIPQESLQVAITDSLNAKMGGVSDVNDDMKNFEEVIKRIETATKVYTSTSRINPGKIKVITDQISEARQMSEAIPGLQEAYETKGNLLAGKLETLQELEEKKAGISGQIAEAGAREQKLGEQKAKIENLEKLRQTQSELDDFFSKGVPTEEELDSWDNRERELEVNRGRREELRSKQLSGDELEEMKDLFDEHPLTYQQLDAWNLQADKIKELRMKGEHSQMTREDRDALTELRGFFRKKLPTAEEIGQQLELSNQTKELSGKLESIEQRYSALRQAQQDRGKMKEGTRRIASTAVFLFLTITVLFGGYYFMKLFPEPSTLTYIISWVCFGLGAALVVMFVLGLVIRIRREKAEVEKISDELADVSDELELTQAKYDGIIKENKSFLSNFELDSGDVQKDLIEIQRRLDRYVSLQDKERQYASTSLDSMDELSELQLELYTAMAHYTTIFGVNLYDTQDEDKVIRDLTIKHAIYSEYLEREREILRLSGEITAESDGLRAVSSSYPVEEPDLIPQALKEIRQKALLYTQTARQISELEETLEQDQTTSEDDEELMSLADLQEQAGELEDKITELRGYIAADRKDMEERAALLSDYEEASGRIPALLEEKADYEEKVRLYEATVKYLNEAKDNFLSAYMGPLQKSMAKYLEKVCPKPDSELFAGQIRLDMNLNLQLVSSGITRSGKHLSAGYQDMAAFCARLALVEVLFKGEKPMMIMDDPFTNYDDDKLRSAMELVKEVSGELQIIYFTCHGSRSFKERG